MWRTPWVLGLIAGLAVAPASLGMALATDQPAPETAVKAVTVATALEPAVAGIGPRTAAQPAPRWLASSAGATSCAVLNSGGVVCWGAATDIIEGARSVRNAVEVSMGADISSGGYTGYDLA